MIAPHWDDRQPPAIVKCRHGIRQRVARFSWECYLCYLSNLGWSAQELIRREYANQIEQGQPC